MDRKRGKDHIEASNPEQYGALAEAVGDRRREAGHLVVLARHLDLPPEKTIAAFAEAMGFDVYTARQRLLAPTPRVLRRETSEGEARQWIDWFERIGLRTFALSEEELGKLELLPQKSLEFQKGSIAFLNGKGEATELPPNDAIALVIGEVTESTRVEQEVKSLLTNKASTGRAIVNRRVELIIDIHRRSAPQALRIRQDSFEFHRLYPDSTGASSVLVRTLAKTLGRELPSAIVFDDFKQVADILGSSRQLISNSSYLQRKGFASGFAMQREKVTQDSTAETFDVYSALARFEVMRCS